MAMRENIKLEQVWEMANYVVYNWADYSIVNELIEEAQRMMERAYQATRAVQHHSGVDEDEHLLSIIKQVEEE